MNLTKISNYPIEFVDEAKTLKTLVNDLSKKTMLSFDTEFDRYRFKKSISLQLVQIFDGETLYLIDSISIKDLRPLAIVFNNPGIQKICFAGGEDLDILNRRNVSIKNVFDVQIAYKICFNEVLSLSGTIKELLDIHIDKGNQRSNWGKRPLTIGQQLYACQDVLHLFKLKDLLHNIIESNQLQFKLNKMLSNLENRQNKKIAG